MRVLVVGGYGGHAGYAFAVAYELCRRGVDLDILLPKGYEYLGKKFSSLGNIQYITLPRKPLEPLYRGIHRWLKAFSESIGLVRETYDAVISAGSNFSIPPSTILKLLKGAQVFVIEDVNRFSKPAKSVKLLHKLGCRTVLHWEEQLQLYPDGLVVGPIYEPRIYEPRDEGYVLVTLGTYGSREVFDVLITLDVRKAVVQTGDVNYSKYARMKPDWLFFNYTEDIHRWIAGASVVITHPGMTSVTARLAYRKPVILLYTRRHSPLYPRSDVRKLAEKLGAVFLEEVSGEGLRNALEEVKSIAMTIPFTSIGSVKLADEIISLS